MSQDWAFPAEIRFIPTEPTPEKLFVVSAKIESEPGIALSNMFKIGTGLPKDLKSAYIKHLIYTYGLSETGKYFVAGPAEDFTEILYIYSTDSLEEAQELMHDDPFYKTGIFHDDWWFPWEVHSPCWKAHPSHRARQLDRYRSVGILPKYPSEIKLPVEELKIDIVTPQKLIVSFSETSREILEAWESPEVKAWPDIRVEHLYSCHGQGGAGTMGYHWLSGPSVDWTHDLTIFSVSSIMMAQLLKENDSFSRHGIFHDHRYFEWCIHMPLRKASPQHKETLKKLLRDAGVELVE